MKAKNSQAAKRLFKKLSALRATLSNDERVILDSIMTEEVNAHKINLGKTLAKNTAKNTAKNAEVNAHKLNLGKTPAKNTAKNAAKNAEVNAHAKILKPQARFDPTREEYQLVTEND